MSWSVVLSYGQPVTALAFDPISDTLWSGNSQGIVAACHGHSLTRGVSFPVVAATQPPQPVNKLAPVPTDHTVRACSPNTGVGAWNRGGMNKWFYSHSHISTFSQTHSSTSTLVATVNRDLLLLNTTTPSPSIVRQSTTPSVITHLHQGSHSLAVAAGADGLVRSYDTRSTLLRATASMVAHTAGVQGLATSGDYIYTAGYGLRAGRPHLDSFIKIYDLRALRSLASIPFPSGPSFINVHPSTPSMIMVTSDAGLAQIIDVTEPTSSARSYPVMVQSFITSTAISPTGAYLAFGEVDGIIHLVSSFPEDYGESQAQAPLNGFEGQPVEWADEMERIPQFEWTDKTPLNSIGLPYYTTTLLSAWTPAFSPDPPYTRPPPQKIPAQILNTMKSVDGIGYSSLPKEMRGKRNLSLRATGRSGSGGKGRFRSVRRDDEPEPPTPVTDGDHEIIPRMYRRVEIEYSKFGVEDFDFEFYNQTSHSGLETHILNSYTNCLVQVLHYTIPLRTVAKSHITTHCIREHCLLCEIGFVFRMLEDARGTNCQTSNFCRTIGHIPQAAAMGLVDYGSDSPTIDYASMIQLFNRFLLEQLSSESASFPYNRSILAPKLTGAGLDTPITQLFGIPAISISTCTKCGTRKEKDSLTRVLDLVYPRKSDPSSIPSSGRHSFATILTSSLARITTYKATCPNCKLMTTFEAHRSMIHEALPPFLAVNASVFNEEQAGLWADERGKPTFLQPFTRICVEDERLTQEKVEYELKALVVQVRNKGHSPHLISLVKLPEGEVAPEANSPWYMFNDFVVKNVTEDEVLSFAASWKLPAIIYLSRTDIDQRIDLSSLPMAIDPAILSHDISLSPNRDKTLIKHRPFQHDEMPVRGTLVAIDAEFVQMQQEEVEYKSDGSKKVLRPSRLSLARVSVLRGEGEMYGVPCIDDHIHTSETIVNYLTEFSGIKFGDLDPHLSRHTLVPLKVAYKKLRLLVDLGCVFIGHGLLKDLRIINIFVPRNQIIDTVDLYFLKERQRRLSLRFLTWLVLKQDIQAETHDSIEDARSALLLYNSYEQFEEEDIVEEKLIEIYREGKRYNWKPPSDRPPSPPPINAASGFNQTVDGIRGLSFQSPLVPPLVREVGDSRYPGGYDGTIVNPLTESPFHPSQQRQQEMQDARSWRRLR